MTTDSVGGTRCDSPNNRVTLTCRSPTRVPPVCIMQPAATLLNSVHTKKIRNLGGQVFRLSLFFHVRSATQPTITDVVQCHIQVERPSSNQTQLCEFLGFRSSPVEVSNLFLGCAAALRGDWYLQFRNNVVVSNSGVKIPNGVPLCETARCALTL